VQEVLVG